MSEDSAPQPLGASAPPTVTNGSSPDYLKWLEKLPGAFLAFSSMLYAIGFVVVNSFFATKGQTDLALVNARYLMAGALFGVAGAMYYFVVFRSVLHLNNASAALLKVQPHWFAPVVGLYLFLDLFLGCAAWACWISGVLVPHLDQNAGMASVAVTTTYLIDRMVLWKSVESKPMTRILVSGMLIVVALAVFGWKISAGPGPSPLKSLFAIGALFTLTATWTWGSRDWENRERRAYMVMYTAFSIVVAAASMGAFFYGFVSQKYGGGLPSGVEVVWAPDVDGTVRANFAVAKGETFYLAGDKDFYTFLIATPNSEQRVIRVDRALVKAVVFTSQESQIPPSLFSNATAASTPAVATAASTASGTVATPPLRDTRAAASSSASSAASR